MPQTLRQAVLPALRHARMLARHYGRHARPGQALRASPVARLDRRAALDPEPSQTSAAPAAALLRRRRLDT